MVGLHLRLCLAEAEIRTGAAGNRPVPLSLPLLSSRTAEQIPALPNLSSPIPRPSLSPTEELLQRVEDTEAAILERSRSLSKAPANSGKQQDAITRALLPFEPAAGKSRTLTRLAAGKRSAPTILKSWMTTGIKQQPKRKPKRKKTSCATILAWMGHQQTGRV